MMKSIQVVVVFLLSLNMAMAQTITSVVADSANTGQSLTVSISGAGTNFVSGSGVMNVRLEQGSSVINAAIWTAITNTSMTADFGIPFNSPGGYYDLKVNTGIDGMIIMPQGFLVKGPVITSVTANTGTPGQSLTVAISGVGTAFQSGSGVLNVSFKQGSSTVINAAIWSIIDNESMTADFTLPNPSGGYYDVNVLTELNGPMPVVLPQGFFINGPRITSMNPDTTKRIPFASLNATIYGTQTSFLQGSGVMGVRLLQPPLPPRNATAYTATTDSTIDATFPPFQPWDDVTGIYDLEVVSGQDGTMLKYGALFVEPGKLDTLNPAKGARNQTISVNITGKNTFFMGGSGTYDVRLVKGPSVINGTSVLPLNDTSLNVNFPIGTLDPLGFWDVHVTTGYDGLMIMPNSFEVVCANLATTATNPSCYSACDGAGSASVTGGTPPYTYSWTTVPPQNTATATGLCAGSYSATVIDFTGCSSSAGVSISEPSAVSAGSTLTPPACNNDCDALAVGSASGGAGAPYTYTWSTLPVQTTLTATGLCGGNTYNLTVADPNGCTDVETVAVTNPLVLSVSVTVSEPSCNNGNDGSATASVSGGNGVPYTYSWNTSPVQNTFTATGLCGSCTYVLTVTDGGGCVENTGVTISEPAALAISTTTTGASCNGVCDGTSSAAVTGGTGPYTYSWSSGGSFATVTALCGGSTYTLTVEDANGCTAVASVTVSEPAVLGGTITAQTNVTCNGGNDGSITVAGFNGTPGYTYDLGSGSQVSGVFSGLSANTYSISIGDTNGCSAVVSANVTEPAAVNVIITSTNNSSCGGADGDASAQATGGTGSIIYIWNDGLSQTTATAAGLAASTYMVIATDGAGCADTAFATVTDAGAPTATLSSTAASCGGSDGTATVSPSGGTTPYTYSWDDVGNQITATATGLTMGSYTVTVTDANNCTFIDTVSVAGNAPPVASIVQSTDVSCFAGSDGTATSSASGGTTPYSYTWNTSPVQTNAIATGLVAGSYTVIITDANSCMDSVPITITEPSLLTATATGSNPTCNGSNDGTASVVAGGGTTPYAYSWNDGSNQTTSTATGLGGGSYTVIVTDSLGCINSALVTLTTPPPAVIITSTTFDETSCQQNGIVLLSVAGGISPYTYAWSTGDTIANLNGLSAGQYFVTVSDSAGCFDIDTVDVSGSVPPMTNITPFDETSCGANDGICLLTVSDGTPPYTYSWSTGATTQNLSGLSGGTYTLMVIDSVGCTTYDTVTVAQPDPPSVSITGFDESTCGASDGVAAAVVNGGTAPYAYSWSNGGTGQNITGLSPGTYILTVSGADGCTGSDAIIIGGASGPSIDGMTGIDESSCGANDGAVVLTVSGGATPYAFNWSSGATTQNLTGVTSGVYTVTVSDANACTDVDSVELLSLGSIVLSVTTTDANCGTNDGNAVVSVTGGTAPYQYFWSSGDSTANADSLSSGIYIATVQDASGCTNSIAASISDVGGATLTIASITDVTCNGGSDGGIDIAVSGGITPYTYAWSNGASSEDISGVPAGPYEINVTDANGCSASQSIIVSSPIAITLTATSTDANCGTTDGSASVSASGGSGSYAFIWTSGGTDSVETSLSAGVYSVTVTDGNGCSTIASAAVSNIGGPTIVTDLIEDADCGNPVGSIYISVSGGTTPYSYEWSDLSTDEDLVGVSAGSYSINITDSSGCVATATMAISGILPAFESICMVTVDTVTGTNLVVWEKNQVQGVASYNLYKESTQVGVYFLIGNVSVDSLSEFVDIVSDPGIRSWRYKMSVVDSCGTESDLSSDHKTIHLTINLGINDWINLIWDHYEGYSYGTYYIERYTSATGWQTIDSIPSNLTSYTDQNTPNNGQLYYQVSVKHPDGCTASKVKNFNSSKSNTSAYNAGTISPMSISQTSSDAAFGNCDGTGTVTVTDGMPPYVYLWDDSMAQTAATATGLCPGSYDVWVFDSNGDSISATIIIGTLSGVEEINLNQHISVYPNPSRGLFTLDMTLVDNLQQVIIFNILGEQILTISDGLHGTEVIDLRNEPNGVYYVQIISAKGIALKKVIIE